MNAQEYLIELGIMEVLSKEYESAKERFVSGVSVQPFFDACIVSLYESLCAAKSVASDDAEATDAGEISFITATANTGSSDIRTSDADASKAADATYADATETSTTNSASADTSSATDTSSTIDTSSASEASSASDTSSASEASSASDTSSAGEAGAASEAGAAGGTGAASEAGAGVGAVEGRAEEDADGVLVERTGGAVVEVKGVSRVILEVLSGLSDDYSKEKELIQYLMKPKSYSKACEKYGEELINELIRLNIVRRIRRDGRIVFSP